MNRISVNLFPVRTIYKIIANETVILKRCLHRSSAIPYFSLQGFYSFPIRLKTGLWTGLNNTLPYFKGSEANKICFF